MTRLKNKNHGLYCSEDGDLLLSRNPAISYHPVSTDRLYMHYLVVHGVPIDQHEDIMIYQVRDEPKSTHATFRLITGKPVMTWDEKIIKELWRLGFPTTIYADIPGDFVERVQYRRSNLEEGMPSLLIEFPECCQEVKLRN